MNEEEQEEDGELRVRADLYEEAKEPGGSADVQNGALGQAVDVMAEAEEQKCVAKWGPDWVDENHNNAQFVCCEEARRLAVDGEISVVQPRVVRPQLEAWRE